MAKELVVAKILGADVNYRRNHISVSCKCGTMWSVRPQSRITNFMCTHCSIQYEITTPMGSPE